MLGDERSVSGLVAADPALRARLLQSGLGAAEGIFLGVEGSLADEALGQQVGVAAALGAGRGEFAFGGSHLSLRGLPGEQQVGGIESGQRLPGLDRHAAVDQTGGDLSADPEGQVNFVTRPDLAGIDRNAGVAGAGRLHQDFRGKRRWRLGTAAGTQRQSQAACGNK